MTSAAGSAGCDRLPLSRARLRPPPSSHRFTIVLYLNSVHEDEGGSTDFFADAGKRPSRPAVGSVQPEAGSAAVFDHGILHSSRRLTSGTKYIARADAIYTRA